jgi:hypothetical protein
MQRITGMAFFKDGTDVTLRLRLLFGIMGIVERLIDLGYKIDGRFKNKSNRVYYFMYMDKEKTISIG